ncbi:MAG TPA: amidohydrolase [Gemmatimonadaceae bacterium]|nr:amidohydrolase [Gemmatimonadaceae bacterium]
MIRISLLLLLPAALAAQQPQSQPADLIVTNARIYTVDEAHPLADAMAVRGGKVQFVGSTRAALALRGTSTRVIDLNGRTVIPGMVDAHGHVDNLGLALRTVDLTGTSSYDEVIARVTARAKTAQPGQWIIGRGWDQNDWGDTRFPTHEKLTAAVPNNPVYLTRIDGHAGLANAAALKAANITAQSKDPEGGHVERGAAGAPAGVFVDNAQDLVERVIPRPTRDEVKAEVQAAIAEAQKWGLTGVHDAGASSQVLDIYEELGKAGQLNFRMYAMISDDSTTLMKWFARGPLIGGYDNTLWVRSIKLYIDGALGSRGAALLDPYADMNNTNGLLVSKPEHIGAVAARALKSGFQVNTHAIGDRGNRIVLDEYEKALKASPVADHRFRVEHAQIISPDDIPRFAELGVIPSMQASHQTSDMYWAGTRLGSTRLLGAYAWRSLLNNGSIIPNGSDFPVEQVNPLISFHAAFSRQDAHDWPPNGWYPEQKMTRDEALRSITLWPAYAAFQEQIMGSLTPGKLADFVVLDQDIMRIAPEQVLRTQVLATYVGGKAVYERKNVVP